MGEKHEGGDCQRGRYAQKPIRPFSSKDFKTTIFVVTLFMVQISLKYFHSLEPQNHITFNLSQIFSTHLLVDINLLELGIWEKGDNYSINTVTRLWTESEFCLVFIFMKVKV